MRHWQLTICAALIALAATACGPFTDLFADECAMRAVGLFSFRVAATTCDEFVDVDGDGPYYVRGMNTSIGPDDLRPGGRITATNAFGVDGDVYELDGVDPDAVRVTERGDAPGFYLLLMKPPANVLPAAACEYVTDSHALGFYCGN
jgi:hypothetical protein